MLKRCFLSSLLFFTAFLFSSCGSTQYFTPVSTVRPDTRQINNDEIRKAFELQPQLVKPLTVALYGAGQPVQGFIDSLRGLPEVRDVYEISPALLEGDRYYAWKSDPWARFYRNPPSTNIDQLRLYAAQAKADLLVYTGTSQIVKTYMNTLAYSYILLITAAFVPGQDLVMDTAVDMVVIDVRNGFLYGSFHDDRVFRKDFISMNYRDSEEFEKTKVEQAALSIPEMMNAMQKLLSNQELYIRANR